MKTGDKTTALAYTVNTITVKDLTMNNMNLSKEDYEEPCCPFEIPDSVNSIPVGRVIEKLDKYLHKNDYDSAERHLKYWLNEAGSGNDIRGKLTMLNELIGLYRKLGKENEGLCAIESALELVRSIGLDGTVTMATTFVNAATAYKSFGKTDEALPLYESARQIYESCLKSDDPRLGGLYNNMALAVMASGNYREAEELFLKALKIMSQNDHGEAEMAITYCNLADLVSAESGVENAEKQIYGYLDKALDLLNTEDLPKDGYYAFVCEKCAPTFGYYGYFSAEKELQRRARDIYERP